MKISVSLPQEDVAFVDEYASRTEATSRSSVIHAAIELLRQTQLEQQYVEAFAEWDGSEDARFWDRFAGDGLTDEAR
ncbi:MULTISPECIES: ribbon-helix-helix domain-containing protein [unclassified Streptomyces]|uniref:ribbon-helix-helix domain-containing protein n=1 Tax=unclassified Streptomyces TaxID=2593676 RepID=UPI0036FB4E04